MARLLGVDLFCGAGGFSLGFEQAGFDVVAAVDIDPISATHKFNFPETNVLPKSVSCISGAELRRIYDIGSREIHCVFGGPPCQGFSLIGHRAIEDPRNKLVLDFVRLVAELGALTFVFENVKGLTVGRHRIFLQELVQAFRDAGYDVVLPWKVLNAANYGVPQHRERLILMGAKRGVELPRYPAAATKPAGGGNLESGLVEGPTCRDAIGDLPDADQYPELLHSDTVATHHFAQPSPYAAEMRCLRNDAWYFGYKREWDPRLLTSSARTIHTAVSRRRFSETQPGQVEPISRFLPTASRRRVQHASGGHRRCAWRLHKSAAYTLSIRAVRDRSGDGAAAWLPRLVPSACDEVARGAANW